MTSDTIEKIQLFLEKQKIRISVPYFIQEVSNVYHKYESRTYDKRHSSIANSAIYWQKVFNQIEPILSKDLIVLDFGCGTGFAINQLLLSPISKHVKKVICYDLSPEMIEVAKEKLSKFDVEIEYLSDLSGYNQLTSRSDYINLILTNAVLHHLLDLSSFFHFIDNSLKDQGVFIMGHEPHSAFYRNRSLVRFTWLYQRFKRLRNRISLNYIQKKIGLRKSQQEDIVALTHSELVRKGLIDKSFPLTIIPKLVDIHVPMGLSLNQPWGELGFDEDLILNNYFMGKQYNFIFKVTYSYIKDESAYTHFIWSRISRMLSSIFPSSGADCIMIFQKHFH